jgi:4-aminobutyrate aminotransferase/(S)-3-amino-2-methylpropionate transaminase
LKVTDIAGLSNQDWQARKEDAVARGQGNIAPVYVERAAGSELWDVEGKRYIDFGTGIAVCSAGHCHPKITAAVAEQLDKFSHTCVMVTPYDSSVRLAEKLNELAPGPSKKKSIFVTTGAEAIENAVKIARAHTGRRGVIAFNGGFHGRTMLAMGLRPTRTCSGRSRQSFTTHPSRSSITASRLKIL